MKFNISVDSTLCAYVGMTRIISRIISHTSTTGTIYYYNCVYGFFPYNVSEKLNEKIISVVIHRFIYR